MTTMRTSPHPDAIPRAPHTPMIVVHLSDANHPEMTACSPMLMPQPVDDEVHCVKHAD